MLYGPVTKIASGEARLCLARYLDVLITHHIATRDQSPISKMEFEDAKTALSDSYISTERIREQVRADIAYSDLSDAGIVAATRLFDKAQHMAKVLNRV